MAQQLNQGAQGGVIIVEDLFLREGFIQLPHVVLKDSTLSPGAKITYSGLLYFAWQNDACFPGQVTLAETLGLSRRVIINHLEELKKKGYIDVIRRGRGQTNIYIIKDLAENGKFCTSRNAKYALPEVQNLHPNINSINITSNNTNNLHETTTTSSESTLFAEVVVALIDQGVSRKTAYELAETYLPDSVFFQVEVLPFRNARDPAAALVAAIRNDWAAPGEYFRSLELKKKEIKKMRLHNYSREEERKLEKGEIILASLSEKDKETVNREARKRCGKFCTEFTLNPMIKKVAFEMFGHLSPDS